MLRKTALITGASGGIGLDLAVLAARDGFDCVLVARNEKKLKELQQVLEKRYQIKVYVFAADLSLSDSVDRLVQYLEEQELTVDLLFNNAGFATSGRFAEIDPTEDINSIQVNVVALTDLTKRLLPGMVERGFGRILNVASVAAFMPGPYMSVYYATKAYVLSFSEALATEVDGSGVSVTCLCRDRPIRTSSTGRTSRYHSRVCRHTSLPSPGTVACSKDAASSFQVQATAPWFPCLVSCHAVS